MLFSSTRSRGGGSDATAQWRPFAALALLACLLPTGAMAYEVRDSIEHGTAPVESPIGKRLAQAQPLPPPSAAPARPATPPSPAATPKAPAAPAPSNDEPIGNV